MKRAGSGNILAASDGIPSARTLDVGGYWKRNEYDYNIVQDSTPNILSTGNVYPAYLVMQNFETKDGNVRLTLGPFKTLS